MDAIKLSATVSEDRRLIVELPDDIPAGPVELVIRPLEQSPQENPYADTSRYPEEWVKNRERFRAKMLAAGILSTAYHAPKGTVPLTPEERMRLGTLPPGARPTDEYIDEDRGPR